MSSFCWVSSLYCNALSSLHVVHIFILLLDRRWRSSWYYAPHWGRSVTTSTSIRQTRRQHPYSLLVLSLPFFNKCLLSKLSITDRFHILFTHSFNILRQYFLNLHMKICCLPFEFFMLPHMQLQMLSLLGKLVCKCNRSEMLLTISNRRCKLLRSLINLFILLNFLLNITNLLI